MSDGLRQDKISMLHRKSERSAQNAQLFSMISNTSAGFGCVAPFVLCGMFCGRIPRAIPHSPIIATMCVFAWPIYFAVRRRDHWASMDSISYWYRAEKLREQT